MGFANTFFLILPIFLVMGVGACARYLGYLNNEAIPALNRLTFYVAIPVMIFLEISGSHINKDFHLLPVLVGACALVSAALFAYLTGRFFNVEGPTLGSFVQSSIHGNLGYMGLAVSYYVMGRDGLIKASIFAGFIIIVQNLVSVVALSVCGGKRGATPKTRRILKDVCTNPIVIGTATGMCFSALKLSLPTVIKETFQLLSKMALPLALLVIGASISIGQITNHLRQISGIGTIKLFLLPALGMALLWATESTISDIQALIILLASPTATVSYIMASQMGGDPSLSSSAISVSTAISIFTYTFWVWVTGSLPVK